MAQTFGVQSAKVLGPAKSTPQAGFVHGSVRCFSEQVVLATQPIADTIVVGLDPKGAIFLYGTIETDTTLGTATIAIGTASVPAKYAAAATYTTVDTPVVFGKTAAVGTTLPADDAVILTIAVAALPASGNLKINLFYAFN
jgi:hypothetical protein